MSKRDLLRWVSLEEKMPESGMDVLLTCVMVDAEGNIVGRYVCIGFYAGELAVEAGEPDGYFPEAYCCEYDDESDRYFLVAGWYKSVLGLTCFDSTELLDPVTHWMPLPELPGGV